MERLRIFYDIFFQENPCRCPTQLLSPFGNKLVQSGYIGAEQMQQALVETREIGADR
ncbi:MAG UNVERIFIED_CONTAM: hypothetical protein LVR29_28550 [Microcystis novacekii LVE1205-3]